MKIRTELYVTELRAGRKRIDNYGSSGCPLNDKIMAAN